MSTDNRPAAGEIWAHTNGNIYLVFGLANVNATNEAYVEHVVYCGSDGSLWTRPLHDWHRSMSLLTGEAPATRTRVERVNEAAEGLALALEDIVDAFEETLDGPPLDGYQLINRVLVQDARNAMHTFKYERDHCCICADTGYTEAVSMSWTDNDFAEFACPKCTPEE